MVVGNIIDKFEKSLVGCKEWDYKRYRFENRDKHGE
jgi:hypothetical protein